MALFKKAPAASKTKASNPSNKIASATIITSCMTINGNLQGSDTIHIDGTVIGNIVVSNTLVIGRSGAVEGNIEAKNVIINGELKGTIKCEHVEVMTTGKVSKSIEAKSITLDGTIEGDIIGEESITVLENSNVENANIRSKTITVNGSVKGVLVATELLEIQSKGFVEGEITVKNIKTEEGGRVIGSMSTYQQPTEKKPTKTARTAKTTKAAKEKEKEPEDTFFS